MNFYVHWNGPSNNLLPKIADLAKKNTNILFLGINIETADSALIVNHLTFPVPIFLFFKDNEKIEGATATNIAIGSIRDSVRYCAVNGKFNGHSLQEY